MPIGLADALQRVFLTTVVSYLQFRGWICQETLCDRSSVTFDLRQCATPAPAPGQSAIQVTVDRSRMRPQPVGWPC